MSDSKWHWSKPSTIVLLFIVVGLLLEQEGPVNTASYLFIALFCYLTYKTLTKGSNRL